MNAKEMIKKVNGEIEHLSGYICNKPLMVNDKLAYFEVRPKNRKNGYITAVVLWVLSTNGHKLISVDVFNGKIYALFRF